MLFLDSRWLKEREEIHREQENRKYENRKRIITELVTAYYNKYDFLQNKRLSDVIDKSLEKFLNTDLTIEQINEQIMDIIINNLKSKDNELNNMMVEENTESKNEVLEKPKVFVKTDNSLDNRGIVHIRQLIGLVIVGVVLLVVITIYFFVR